MSGRTRRRPTSTLPETPVNVRSPWYHPKPSVGPNPGAGARPKLTPYAMPTLTSSSNGKMPPNDPPTPARLTMFVITWADAFAVLTVQARTTHATTRFLIHNSSPYLAPARSFDAVAHSAITVK